MVRTAPGAIAASRAEASTLLTEISPGRLLAAEPSKLITTWPMSAILAHASAPMAVSVALSPPMARVAPTGGRLGARPFGDAVQHRHLGELRRGAVLEQDQDAPVEQVGDVGGPTAVSAVR